MTSPLSLFSFASVHFSNSSINSNSIIQEVSRIFNDFQKNSDICKMQMSEFCYPIMRLHFWSPWRKDGGKPLLRTPKIKQFQGFAAVS